jgi:hypothetical protein
MNRDRFLRKKRQDIWDSWLEEGEPDATAVAGLKAAEPVIAVQKRHYLTVALLVIVGIGLVCSSVAAGVLSKSGPRTANTDTSSSNILASDLQDVSNSDTTANKKVLSASTGESNTKQPNSTKAQKLTTQDPYYQYVDTFKGASVEVSRQPLPVNYKADPQALPKFADQLGAQQQFVTDKWGMAYILTSSNAQVLVFAGNDRLVILRSSSPHSTTDWKGYIDGLVLK